MRKKYSQVEQNKATDSFSEKTKVGEILGIAHHIISVF